MKLRACSFLLIFTLLVGGLSGCAIGNRKKESSYDEFLVVDVFDSLANYQGLQSGWYAKILNDKFNMQFNIIAPNVSGGVDTLYEIRSAAGNMGDLIICSAESNNLQKLVDAGLLYNMEEALDGKDIMEYKDAIDSLNDGITQEGIYAIPSQVSRLSADIPSEGLELNYGTYLRWDIYKEIGYPEITDLNSLLDVLEEMQKAYPVGDNGNPTYAFSLFNDWDGNMLNNAKQPACLYGYDEVGFVLAKVDGKDYQNILHEDSWYIKALKLFREANKRGLLDPGSKEQDYSTVFSKYREGNVLFSFWPWLGQSAYNTEEHTQEGKGFMLAPMKDMEIVSYGCNPLGNNKTVIAIGSQAKDPERLVDYINWLYSSDGIIISGARNSGGTAGPLDLTWKVEDGQPVLTEFGRNAFYSNEAEVPEEWGGGTWSGGTCQLNYMPVAPVEISPSGIPYHYTLWSSVQNDENSLLQQEWQEHMNAQTTIEYLEKKNQMIVAPGCPFVAPGESKEITTKRKQCRKVIVEYSWKMIYTEEEEEFQRLYKDLLTIVSDMGYEEVLELDMEIAKLQNKSREEALR